MTDKIALTNIVDLTNETTAVNSINNNNNTIAAAFDNTLSRDGTQPNAMEATLDMNSNPIINLPAPSTNFSPLRMIDAETLNGGGTITIQPLPTGGTTGQVLEKNSNANFDVSWQTISSSGGTATPSYNTLADAQASFNAPSVTNITIVRKQAGWPLANAPYVRGTVSGPNAFQDALGNYWQVDTSGPRIQAVWFWPAADGVTDDTTPLSKALIAAGGKTLLLGSYSYVISSQLNVLRHTVVQGDGKTKTTITCKAGVEFQHGIFFLYDLNNLSQGWITIDGISLIGNGICTLPGTYGAIIGGIGGPETADEGFVKITNCLFQNFAHDYWIGVINNSNNAVHAIGPVYIEDNEFISLTGNCRDYSGTTGAGYQIYIWGSPINAGGSINDVYIRRNISQARFVLQFVAVWQNTGYFTIEDNVVFECAQLLTTTANVYVIMTYDGAGGALGIKGGIFNRNQTYNTVTGGGYIGPGAGIYCAGPMGCVICTENRVQGITRSDFVSLVRGGIVINGAGQSNISDNNVFSCFNGIVLFGPADNLTTPDLNASTSNLGVHNISNNTVSSNAGSSNAFWISWTDAGTNAPKVLFNGNVTRCTNISHKAPGTFGSITDTNNI